jgi:large conductance mechanosensitive channel
LDEARKQGAVLAWGRFLTLAINFVIIAVVLFFVVRLMNRMLRAEAEKTPELSKQEQLLTEIRDALQQPARQTSGT